MRNKTKEMKMKIVVNRCEESKEIVDIVSLIEDHSVCLIYTDSEEYDQIINSIDVDPEVPFVLSSSEYVICYGYEDVAEFLAEWVVN